MKKLIIAIACAVTTGVFAQGTFLSENRALGATPPIDAPIKNGATGLGFVGTAGSAQFYAGPAGALPAALTPVGPVYNFDTRAGREGYIVAGDTLTVAGVVGGGTATIQLRAWTGAATYDLATGNRGSSATIQLVLGNAGSPPSLPSDPTGLQGFTTTIPEPATIALAGLGAAALLFRRRKA